MSYTEKEVVFLFHYDRLKITISTVINTIRNMSGLNVECGMSAAVIAYIIDWRKSDKTATFFGLERNHSTTVKNLRFRSIRVSFSCKWRINFKHFHTLFLTENTRSSGCA